MKKKLLLIVLIMILGCKKESTLKITKFPKKDPLVETIKTEGAKLKIDSSIITTFNDKTLFDFYKLTHFETVWQSDKKRATILDLLSKSESDGLNPQEYAINQLESLEKRNKSLTVKERIYYDLVLTKNFQKYLRHLGQGKLNPLNMYSDWDLIPNKFNSNEILIKVFQRENFLSTIDSCKPNHIVYKKLKDALQIINTFPKDTIKPIEFKDKIVLNDTNKSIVAIKRKLIYWHDLLPKDSLNDIYDKTTMNGVKKFQLRHGLSTDGVIGKSTVMALNYSKEQRKEQIIANLERWKWFPRTLSNHYIIINIPGFYLRVVKDQDTIEKKRVVVGTSKRKTPILSSTFSNIVLNPTWTVPPTILKEDLIPSASTNRSYFASRKITIYDSKHNEISPEKWNPDKAKSYRYVQSSGYNNSLGTVKFNFPNRHSVYLHDTNHRDFFGKNFRSLSSGCVRVENPLPLAAYLINDAENWSLDKINEIVATKKTTSIVLKNKINLYQWYWTAWSENNQLVFREDIYNLDSELYRKLRN